MPEYILPVHILYHNPDLTQPIRNELARLGKDMPREDLPVKIRTILIGTVLDALSTPANLARKLIRNPEEKFRIDFRGAFAQIVSDYKRLKEANPNTEIYPPEIMMFLSKKAIEEMFWKDFWGDLNKQFHPTVYVYWLRDSSTHFNDNEVKDLMKTSLLAKSCEIIDNREPSSVCRQKFDDLRTRIIQDLKFLGEQQRKSASQAQKTVNATAIAEVKPQPPLAVSQVPGVNLSNPQPAATLGEGKAPEAKPAPPPSDKTIAESVKLTPDAQALLDQNQAPAGSQENAPVEGQAPATPPTEAAEEQTQAAPPAVVTVPNAVRPTPPPKPVSAEWKIIEPPAKMGDRKPHYFTDTRRGPRDWMIVGASRRGKLHENEGTFREDAFCIEVEAGWLLIAVADGAGSHHLSRVGSNEAVQKAVEKMKELVRGETPGPSVANTAISKALEAAWVALYNEAQKRESDGTKFKDLSTTLLLMMYHPAKNLVGVAQIGDGLLAVQLENGQIATLGRPESGEYSGQTYFLTNYKKEELASKAETPTAPGPIKYILVMTDGVADDLYPPLERLPGLIKPMPSIFAADDPEEALKELINYNRAGSFDDRTLVVACQPSKILAGAPAAPEEAARPAAEAAQVEDMPTHAPPAAAVNPPTPTSQENQATQPPGTDEFSKGG